MYNTESEVMVSYDDARAFGTPRAQLPMAFTNLRLQTGLKGQFIYDTDLAGFAMWEAGGDSNDILLDAIRSGMNRGMTFC